MKHSKTLYCKGLLKDQKMLTQSQYSKFRFVSRFDNIKNFYNGVKAINFAENGYVQITEDGLRITVDNGKAVQANLYVAASCFREYYVDGVVNFGINMNVFSHCMSLHGNTNSNLKMYYKGPSSPLVIVFVSMGADDFHTECSIKTLYYEEPIEYSVNEDCPKMNVLFIKGPELCNIFKDLDRSADELLLILSPNEPYFNIKTVGIMHTQYSVQVSKNSEMMELFNCRDTTNAQYKCSHMKLTAKAMATANKVALKTDASGLLEMHFLFQTSEQAEIYAQFYIPPLADLD